MGQLDLSALPDKTGKNEGLDLSSLPDQPAKEVKEPKQETWGEYLKRQIIGTPEQNTKTLQALESALNDGTLRIKGSSLTDTNATWWDKTKDVLGLLSGPSSPDAAALSDFEQRVVSPAVPRIPYVREGGKAAGEYLTPEKPTSTLGQAYKDVVGGGMEGIGEMLSDPRTYLMPRIFEFGAPPRGMRAPSRFGKAEVWDENIPFAPGTKNVTPTPARPGTTGRFLRASDEPGVALKPYHSELPPNTPRRFLGNAETLTPLAARDAALKPTSGSATDIRERGPGWVDVEKPEPGGEKKRLRFTKEGTLVDPQTGEDGIQLARTKDGRIKLGQNIERSAGELTTGYSADLPTIMVREALQNAIDAVKSLGDKGQVRVYIPNKYASTGLGDDKQPFAFTVEDNGKGMTRKELETVFSDLNESGKTTESGATGGKGVGKASYMLGGQHFKVETTTKEGPNIVRHTMEFSPQEFIRTGVKPKTELMPADTPTGTKITTTLDPESTYTAGMEEMVKNIQRFSRGIGTNIQSEIQRPSWSRSGEPKGMQPSQYPVDLTKHDTPIGTVDLGHSDVDLIIPHDFDQDMMKGRTSINLVVLNNGMYQYQTGHYLGEESRGLPDNVIVNVRPKVEEGTTEYPFPVQRESVKDKVGKDIANFVNDKLVNPKRERAKSKLAEIYDNLATIPSQGGHRFRNSILFDPGDRLTKSEKNAMLNSPFVKQFADYIDSFIEEALIKLGDESVHKKLEGVGIVLDPNMHGVHIPNPMSNGEKSIILINPFTHPTYEGNPFEAAIATAVTIQHELAHIGRGEPSGTIRFSQEDLMHPDVGRFMETYYKEVQNHGGLDLGHGMHFVKRLGEIYGKVGIEQPIQFSTDLTRLLSGSDSRGNILYTPEFQDLLRVYDESRGRQPSTEDYLSGTGVKSVTPSGRRRGAQSSNGGNAGGVPPKRPIIDRIGQYDSGRSKPPDPVSIALRNQVENDGILLRAAGFFKGMKATADLGPVLRQGIAYTGRPFWWKALRQQFVSYASEGGHDRFIQDMRNDPLNQPRWVSAGGKATSWYDMAGVDITHLGGPLRGQEEAIMGMDLTEKPIQWLSEKTGLPLINPVRASNRAYSDAILTLRRGASQVLYDNYKKVYESAKKSATTEKGKSDAESYNPDNPLVAQNIGLEVNRASGRGRLSTPELKLPKSRFLGPASGAKLARSFSAEPVADILAVGMFSPRLFTSRIQNINKVLNPWSWATSPKPMRIEYLKQLLSIAGIIVAGNSLMSLFGAETGPLGGDEPTSPDFLKSRFGRGRRGVNIDFTGGYGRFATLGARLSSREVTTGAGKRYRVGQPPIGDAVSLIEDFGEGLASPVMQAAMQLLNQKEFGNKPLDMTNPNPFENSAGKALLTPMISQDLYDLLQEDPSYVPLLFPDALGAPLTIYGQ